MGESAGTTASASSVNYGSAIQAGAGLYAAYAQNEAGKYNSDAAEINASLADRQKRQALKAGGFAVNRAELKERLVEGADRAAAAGSGVLAGSGSNRAVIESNRAASHMDEAMIAMNARREAYGYAVRAQAFRQAGDLAEVEGHNQAIGTLLQAGGQSWKSYTPSTFNFGPHDHEPGSLADYQTADFRGYGSH